MINQKREGKLLWGKKCPEEIRSLIEKKDYGNRSKKRRQDFSRERKMPFKN
jgi:hypothetical protein